MTENRITSSKAPVCAGIKASSLGAGGDEMWRPEFGFEPDPRASAVSSPCSLFPLHAYASLLLYQTKAKIVTKIKACISVLKCTEEVSLLKEEGCGDEENYVCFKAAAPPIRPRLNSNHKSKAFKMLLFSFVDLSVSRTTKTYKTVKYKASTFWLVWLLPLSSIILKRRQTSLQLTAQRPGHRQKLTRR